MERIGFGARFGAALIDIVVILIAMAVLGPLFGVGATAFAMAGSEAGFSLGILIIMLIPVAYSSTEVFLAGTPGKKILKLAIRNEDGTPAEQNTLIKRWVIKNSGSFLNLIGAITTVTLFSSLGSLAGFVIFIGSFLVFMEAKMALHDKLAKTAVYKA
jgi:uncharacterized RDD family membrane protein YckC